MIRIEFSQTANAKSTDLTDTTQKLLGITALLAQLPLIWHLPLWIAVPGMLLVLRKVTAQPKQNHTLHPILLLVFLALAVAAVYVHYGYWIGRDPCIAFLFLLLSFKYTETNRTPDASLLIILCAFLLMTQFFFRQSLIAAILSVPSMYFIGLSLFSLQRGQAKTDTKTMVHITAKLFLQAMPIALLLFIVVPRLSHAPWSGINSGHATTGLSSSMSPGSIASLSKSNEVAFRVEFNSTPPWTHERYWRGPVMTGFDGENWFIVPEIARVTNDKDTDKNVEAISSPPTNSRQLEYTVTMSPSYQNWILALDTPTTTPVIENDKTIQIDINNALQIDTNKPINKPLRYHAVSAISDRFRPSLQPGVENLITAGSNPKARQLARQLRGAHNSNSALALAILNRFNNEPFHYTLNPPKLSATAIDDFLFSTKRGFCEHYASSFVFLMRAAGVPARVVTGYQGGEMSDGYMIVRQSDAHAWAEAFIDGHWQRYDPTAAVAPNRVEQGASETFRQDPSASFLQRLDLPILHTISLRWDSINFAWQRMIINFDASNQRALWKRLGIEKPSAWLIVVAMIVAAIIWGLIILRPIRENGRKPITRCDLYWQKLTQKLRSGGLAQRNGETQSAYIERAVEQWPQHAESLRQIITCYHSGTYAREGEDEAHYNEMADHMKQLLRQLRLTKQS